MQEVARTGCYCGIEGCEVEEERRRDNETHILKRDFIDRLREPLAKAIYL